MRTNEVQDQEPLSLFQILGPSSSTCGYCSPSGQRSKTKSSKTFGIWAHQMSCKTYKQLIDRGWRRSGSYVYKPDMKATCCPQYTIRLEASKFKPGKSQRSIVNRFNNFIREGGHEGEPGYGPPEAPLTTPKDIHGQQISLDKNKKGKGKAKLKGKNAQPFDLFTAIHAAETKYSDGDTKHRFEVTMEAAAFSEEKYELYKRYQIEIHGDKESKVTEDGFRRFLCDSPLELERSPINSQPYGSFHQLYRLDGKLIAIGVLDILPGAVSGVYFIYDPRWSGLSLGKLSALRECALSVELEKKGFPKMYYMMGYYIHTCQKMKYKAEYEPSFLLDPVTYEFLPFNEVCKPMLDVNDHAIFSEFKSADSTSSKASQSLATSSEDSATGSHNGKLDDDSESDEGEDDEDELSKPPPPGFLDPDHLPEELLAQVYTVENGRPLPLILSRTWRSNAATRRKIQQGIAAMGSAAIETCLFA